MSAAGTAQTAPITSLLSSGPAGGAGADGGLMIGRRLPLSALAGMVLPYPTLSEAGKRAAQDFYAPRLLSPGTKRLIGWLKRLP